MAIEVNLEKYGHKKKGFLGFSWTAFFFNFFVPLFRLDFIGFLIFVSPYLIIAVMVSFILITGVNDENTIFVSIVISLIQYIQDIYILLIGQCCTHHFLLEDIHLVTVF